MNDDREDTLQDALRDALLDAIKPEFPEPNRVQAIKQRLMRRVDADRPVSGPDGGSDAAADAVSSVTAWPRRGWRPG